MRFHFIYSCPIAAYRCFFKVISIIFLAVHIVLPVNAQEIQAYQIQLGDGETDHVYAIGERVNTTLRAKLISGLPKNNTSSSPLYYEWQDMQGKLLSSRVSLPVNQVIALQAPPLTAGFLQLVVGTERANVRIMDREVREPMRFGFVIRASNLSRHQKTPAQSQFGLVHTDRTDQDAPVWLKTMTWHTTPANWWRYEIQQRRDRGFEELPIVSGKYWQSDDQQAISESQLISLGQRFRDFLMAAKDVKYWELGIEENLSARYRQPFYWANLTRKVQQISQQRNAVGSDTQFIYQIAETRINAVQNFLQSDAAAYFDILSLHPYAWPDFPDPESWLPDYLQKIRTAMQKTKQVKPIWFTEVGAPLRGHHPDEFFGYPESGVKVSGFSDEQSVEYMIKLHVVALTEGVEKIFWYNYRDREAAREFAENHFGLVDVRGFPKPIYAAYMQMVDLLYAKQKPQQISDKKASLAHYRFEDQQSRVEVLWSRDKNKMINYHVTEEKTSTKPPVLYDALGKPINTSTQQISINHLPIFVVYQR